MTRQSSTAQGQNNHLRQFPDQNRTVDDRRSTQRRQPQRPVHTTQAPSEGLGSDRRCFKRHTSSTTKQVEFHSY